MADQMEKPTREMQSMTTDFNGASSSDAVFVASSDVGTSLNQQTNMNINNVEMLEAGNQFYRLESEGDLIAISSDDELASSEDHNLEDLPGSDPVEIISDHNTTSGSKGKGRQCRHTPEQIHEMEIFFNECPHPDHKERKQLASRLGLKPEKIKFWFQNKRNSIKNQNEHYENQQLRNENERLKVERVRLQEALHNNVNCSTCADQSALNELTIKDQERINMENQRLREEINRISSLATRNNGHMNISENPIVREVQEVGQMFREISESSNAEKTVSVKIAIRAMNEVVKMATMNDPNLWVPSLDGTITRLNHEVYFSTFADGIGLPLPGFKFEASHATAVVMMNHISLVELFMNVNQWSTIFSSMVSRAQTLEVLIHGLTGTYHGALHLMAAEFHLPTPAVPNRSTYFARHCKKHNDMLWSIADVSIEISPPSPLASFRRRPSGCLIEALPNGYSKVTWVEHVEVDDRLVHQLYKPLVDSSLAFGAQRWLGTLISQSERLASVAAFIPSNDLANMGISQEGRRSMMRLSGRLMRSYHQGVSSTSANTWTLLSGSGTNDIRIMSSKNFSEPGRPVGVILCATTSFWISVPHKTTFNYLCNVNNRGQWDILGSDAQVEEIMHFKTGSEASDCVSLLRVSGTTTNVTRENMLIIQETCADALGSCIIFAPLDRSVISRVLAGEDSSYMSILPTGVSILPDGTKGLTASSGNDINTAGGSLLTVSVQLHVNEDPNAIASRAGIGTINGLISCTVERIKAYVTGSA